MPADAIETKARTTDPHEEGLRHQLSAGQMAMVAVGGSIGTGLLLGSGEAVKIAGPAAILSFLAAAFINWTVAMALGELACAHPAAGSFGVYGGLYLNSFAGFLARAGYWVGLALAIGTEMIAAATYMAAWFPGVPPFVWIVIFGIVLLAINLRSVGSYGKFEFWLSMIKLVTIIAFILVGAALLTSGRAAQQYTVQGGFFPTGFWTPVVALTYAVYSFGGVEMVAVTTGESRSTKDIPRAVWVTFIVLTFVYVGAISILVGMMPWNHAGVTESPFVTTFRTIRIPHASDFMNFVVLTAALSGANATLYVAARMIFSLARTGWAPASLGRLNHEGSPQNAVLHSSFGILLALAMVLFVPQNAFRYMLGAAFTGMITAWLVSLLAHIVFRSRKSQAELALLPLRSPLGLWGSVVGFIGVSVAVVQTWLHPLVNLWSGLSLLLALSIAFLLLRRRSGTRLIS